MGELGIAHTFARPGYASFTVGGQWGSEGKGAAVAWLADLVQRNGCKFDVVTCNSGAQAGHTSIHNGVERVVFHLPTAPIVAPGPITYLNSGAIIDPKVLMHELDQNPSITTHGLRISPNAAVITDDCRQAEGRDNSAQTKIASTRKGVGEALARKVLRSGAIARDTPELRPFLRRMDLNGEMLRDASVLVEVPQGFGLSLNGEFYPYCTSRDSSVMQGMSDAGINPRFVGATMMVLRTYPIRVGNIADGDGNEIGNSGGYYPDQTEISWEKLAVRPEITTVTKRVRRVFTWSQEQVATAMMANQPDLVYLSHCDYFDNFVEVNMLLDRIHAAATWAGKTLAGTACSFGPATSDVVLLVGNDRLKEDQFRSIRPAKRRIAG